MSCINPKAPLYQKLSKKFGISTDDFKLALSEVNADEMTDSEIEKYLKQHFNIGASYAESDAEVIKLWKDLYGAKNGYVEIDENTTLDDLQTFFGEENIITFQTPDGKTAVYIPKPKKGAKSKVSKFQEAETLVERLKAYSDLKEQEYQERKVTEGVKTRAGLDGVTVSEYVHGTDVDEALKIWGKPASPIGDTVDTVVRDFFNDDLKSVYPNLTDDQLEDLVDDLKFFKENLDHKFTDPKTGKVKQYKVITDTFYIYANLTRKDQKNKSITQPIIGSIDMLVYDEDGNFYIYDIKTHRSELKQGSEKVLGYQDQLNTYKAILEASFPEFKKKFKIKEVGLLTFSVGYNHPSELDGTQVATDSGPILRNGKPVYYEDGTEYTTKGKYKEKQLYADGTPIQQHASYIAPRLDRRDDVIFPLRVLRAKDQFSALDDTSKIIAEDLMAKDQQDGDRQNYKPNNINLERNELYNNSIITAEERTYLSSFLMKTASYIITHLQTDKRASDYYFPGFFNNDFTTMSRKEIVEIVGMDTIFLYIKEKFFNPEVRDDLSEEGKQKLQIAYNNWDALKQDGYATLIGLEDVSVIAADSVVKEGIEAQLEDIEDSNENKEREYWQIHFRQLSATSSLSTEIRRNLGRQFSYALDGDGNPRVDKHPLFNMDMFIDEGTAVNTIMELCRNCDTIDEMLDVLNGALESEPWLSAIIGWHDDAKGIHISGLIEQDPSLKSKFFSNFRKDFTEYSTVYVELDRNGNRRYITHVINTRGASRFLLDQIVANFREGQVDIVKTLSGTVDGRGKLAEKLVRNLQDKIKEFQTDFEKLSKSRRTKAFREAAPEITKIMRQFGIPVDVEIVSKMLLQDAKKDFRQTTASNLLSDISKLATQMLKQVEDSDELYNPVYRDDETGHKGKGNVYNIYKRIVNRIEPFIQDGVEASTYENGKMYYSFQTPSYMGRIIRNLKDASKNPEKFNRFMQEQYKRYRWFYNANNENPWSNDWLRRLQSEQNRDILEHKVQLSFDGNEYRELSELGYTLSLMSEFFYDNANTSGKKEAKAWYRVPILSNKPSSEFIKFIRFVGNSYKDRIMDNTFIETAYQELMRIKTVLERGGQVNEKIVNWDINDDILKNNTKLKTKLSNRDSNGYLKKGLELGDLVVDGKLVTAQSGASFKFMEALNQEFVDGTELGKLMLKYINYSLTNQNKYKLSDDEDSQLQSLLEESISDSMEKIVTSEMSKWEQIGLYNTENKTYSIETGRKNNKKVEKVELPTYVYAGSFINSPAAIYQQMVKTGNYEDRFDKKNNLTEEFLEEFQAVMRDELDKALENYVWNDMAATINIIELTATDLAYFKNVEDFQKRYAAVHSPGIRMDVDAEVLNNSQYGIELNTDGGKKYSDGYCRVLHISDIMSKSDIIENVKQVFDEKIKSETDSAKKMQWKALRDSILGQFENFNITDGQGYSSPTSYRKKMGMLGRWTDAEEAAYDRIVHGTYTVDDLSIIWQPLKPFVFTQTAKPTGAKTMVESKVPMQVKDSEYMLLIADAILRGSKKKNALTAIFDFMEDSAFDGRVSKYGEVKKGQEGIYNGKGIDTVAFVSTSKFGSYGVVDITPERIETIKEATGSDDEYSIIKSLLKQAAYYNEKGEDDPENGNDRYDSTYVHTFPFIEYAIQQEVPSHLIDHSQAMGSQIRILSISDIDAKETFQVGDETMKGEALTEEYQSLIRQNIEDSLDELSKDLGLNLEDRYERNKALEGILQEAILKDQRYGKDLLRACTLIDKGEHRGEFLIPLSDPIQSIRIQQLINSIIKSRINKQRVKGGPTVQTSVYGMSDDLSIRFMDKDGNLLDTFTKFREDNGLDNNKEAAELYKEYLEENQARMAHWEVYMTVPSERIERILKRASEKDGINYFENLDKAVEKGYIKDEQLKAIGYRIPTEDKYSMAPMKIKGFLPRSAGEVIMMPKEVTLLTGSDFDIDKMYMMFKDFHIEEESFSRVDLSKEDRTRIIEKIKELHPEFVKDIPAIEDRSFSQSQLWEIFGKIYEDNPYIKSLLATSRRLSNEWEYVKTVGRDGKERTKIKYEHPLNYYFDARKGSTEYKRLEELAKKRGFDNVKDYKQHLVAEAASELGIEEIIEVKKDGYSILDKEAIANAGVKSNYEVFKEAADILGIPLSESSFNPSHSEKRDLGTRAGRNNRIFDLQWAVLTSNDAGLKAFNPGSFNVQKKSARIVTILKSQNQGLSNTKYTYAQLADMTLKQLEKIADSSSDYNILQSTTQVYFHKQNMTAGKLIGIFANNNTSHGFLSMQNITLNLNASKQNQSFSFEGVSAEDMETLKLDNIIARDGITYISKNIAGYLAASVDAVKDPVLNFLNLNTFTSGPAMVLIRLGFDVDSVSLLMTQPIIEKVTSEFFKLNNERYISQDEIIENYKRELAEKYHLGNPKDFENSLEDEHFNKSDMSKQIGKDINDLTRSEATYQMNILLLFQRISKIASQLQTATFLTKFNSVSNAAGPGIADTFVMRDRLNRFMDLFPGPGKSGDNLLSDNAKNIIENSDILSGFYEATVGDNSASAQIFRDHLPHYSNGFQEVLKMLSRATKFSPDARLINTLLNDFMLYKLTMGDTPVFNADKSERMRFMHNFIKEYKEIARNIVGNPLIDVIQVRTRDRRCPVATLEAKTGSYSTATQERIKDAWSMLLQDSRPEVRRLGIDLFFYNLSRSGFGFSPKTFGHLASVDVRLNIPEYIETLRDVDFLDTDFMMSIDDFFYMFLRNHADNPKLVPRVNPSRYLKARTVKEGDKEYIVFTFDGKTRKGIRPEFVLNPNDLSEDKLSPVIWYKNTLYMLPEITLDTGDEIEVRYEKTTPLGNTNNFLEYNANRDDDSDDSGAHMKSMIKQKVDRTVKEDKDNSVKHDDGDEEISYTEAYNNLTMEDLVFLIENDIIDPDEIDPDMPKYKEARIVYDKVMDYFGQINSKPISQEKKDKVKEIKDKLCG